MFIVTEYAALTFVRGSRNFRHGGWAPRPYYTKSSDNVYLGVQHFTEMEGVQLHIPYRNQNFSRFSRGGGDALPAPPPPPPLDPRMTFNLHIEIKS